MTTNLVTLKKVPIAGKKTFKHEFEPLTLKPQRRFNERIVKKAIYKFCSPELADKAINGYRMSDGTTHAILEDLKRTDQPYHPVKRDYHYLRALRVCEKLFRPSRRLKPIAFPDLRYYPWNLSVSAEAPYNVQSHYEKYVRQKQSMGEIDNSFLTFHNLYNEIFNDNRRLVHDIKDGHSDFFESDGTPKPYYWTNVHARAHLVQQEDPDKLRAVFGVPKLLLFTENMFIWNIQREYLNNNFSSPMLWGYETFKGGWNKLYTRIHRKKFNSVLSIDWKQFDRRALHEVIDDVHHIWRSWFDFDAGYEPTSEYPNSKTNPSRIENLWKWMTDMVKHYPMRVDSGHMYKWTFNGIASGFQQTQLLDSFVNTIMILTCLSSLGINIEAENFQLFVQGDDSLVTFCENLFIQYGEKLFLEKLSKEALTRFNALLSDTKSKFSNSLSHVDVLHYSNKAGRALRPEAEFLAHLLYPERTRSLGATASAAAGIAQAAMGSSRTVYNVCLDVYNFIKHELSEEPTSKFLQKQRVRASLPEIPTVFPSFDETFSQNYSVQVRTETENERLWPTDPSRMSFYFLHK